MHLHPHHHDDAPARQPWTTLVLLAVAQFMVILDVTVVNVALPSIGDSLGFSADRLPWVVTAYVLFTGGLMLLGGRATDLVGRRVVFLSGLTVFTAVSLAGGLAWSPASLIAARAVQGIGAGAPAVRGRGTLDLAGAATLMGGLVALLLAVDGAPTVIAGAAAVVLLAAFAAIERTARRPLVPAATWRIRSLVSSPGVMLTATGFLVGAFFLNTLFLQRALDASPLETGLAFLRRRRGRDRAAHGGRRAVGPPRPRRDACHALASVRSWAAPASTTAPISPPAGS